MREVETVRQQLVNDKHYYTGDNGQGFIIKDSETGAVVETAPTYEQAEWTVAKFKESTGRAFEIVSAGDQDAKGHADGSPFKFVPVRD